MREIRTSGLRRGRGLPSLLYCLCDFVRSSCDIQSNHGDGAFTGLSEVQFNGSPVPIPGALWLLGSGIIGLIGIRRKRA